MEPISFDEANTIFVRNQKKYLPVPAWTDGYKVVSCWRVPFWRRVRLLFDGRLWLIQKTFDKPLQTQRPEIECPLDEVVK